MPLQSKSVFISHAGSNSAEAAEVNSLLRESGLAVRVDVSEVGPGTDFVAFMESALAQSDYCLLLWSRAAYQSQWVKLEWEAALHRAVSHSTSFLIVGRLENLDLPMLLRPRISVDLYPRIAAGMSRVIAVFRNDASVAEQVNRPVVKPRADVDDDADGVTIYVTSKFWGRALPLRIRLNTPAIAVTERVVTMLGLPRELSADRATGPRLEYGLATDAGPLTETAPLDRQGVTENTVLWLETSLPNPSGDGRVTYRSDAAAARVGDSSALWLRARDTLRSRIAALGLN